MPRNDASLAHVHFRSKWVVRELIKRYLLLAKAQMFLYKLTVVNFIIEDNLYGNPRRRPIERPAFDYSMETLPSVYIYRLI